MMPMMTGLELARALRASSEERPIPIVLMSAASEHARSAPYASYLPKPFDAKALLDTIEQTLAISPRGAEMK